MNETLRPRSVAELLDHTVEMYRHRFVLLFGISAVFFVPLLCLSLILTDVLSTIVSLGSIVVSLLVSGAISYAVACVYLDRPVTILGAYRVALRFGLSLMGAVIITGLVIGVLVLLVVGAMIAATSLFDMFESFIGVVAVIGLCVVGILAAVAFGVLFIMAPTVVVLEGKKAMAAVHRSYELVRANWRRVWAAQICVLVMLYALAAVFLAPYGILVSALFDPTDVSSMLLLTEVSSLIFGLASTLVTPLQMIMTVLLYYDARIRLEGFDIETLAQRFSDAPPSLTGKPESAQ